MFRVPKGDKKMLHKPPENHWCKAGSIHVAYTKFWPDPTIKVHSRNRNWTTQCFSQSSYVQFWWPYVNRSLSFLFLPDKIGNWCGLLLLQSICFNMLCIQRGSLAYLGCTESFFFKLVLPSCQFRRWLAIPISVFLCREVILTGYFLFLEHPL